ncbi:MAG TPA: NAD(P)H-dependent oxidoreductase subunit E [Anaerolineales bacterium]|nr:NAD(P)H-dependent oxidoreductase subunit E [Anaerolineales bacterium]
MTNKKIVYHPISPEIEEMARHHGNKPEAALELLKNVQTHHSALTIDSVTDAARALKLPPHQLYGMATFYSMLSLEERRKVLRVCDGPVCWLKRASETREAIEKTACAQNNHKVTIERTSCLGLCDRAPAVLVEDEQAGPIDHNEAWRLCEGWRGTPTDYSEVRNGETRVMTALIGKIDPD